MDIEVVRRISLARHLYELGTSYLQSSNDLYLFSAVNLLQDSIEAFLVAIADHVGAALDEKTHFDKYFVEIDRQIVPSKLPFKSKLLRLNRIRVDSKHHGIQPAREECVRLSLSVREFFDEVSNSILNTNFSTISTIDLLQDGEVKNLLGEAKHKHDMNDYRECSICCRKALFLELECHYDVRNYLSTNVAIIMSKAPYYAHNTEYIDTYVKDPTDFIVIDHYGLDRDLVKYGIDNTAFWNVWRLTPAVYRILDDSTNQYRWIVKEEYVKLDSYTLTEEIDYIFNTTVDIIFAIHSQRTRTKSLPLGRYYVELIEKEAPIYEKADESSKIAHITPNDLNKIFCDFFVEGLKGDAIYWHVLHIDTDLKIFLSGYLHQKYIDLSNE